MDMIVHDIAFEADHISDQSAQLLHRHIRAAADVHPRDTGSARGFAGVSGIVLHQENAGVSHVVDVHEFTHRRAGPPHFDSISAGFLCLVEFPYKSGDNVGMLGVVVVARSVEVTGHYGEEIGIVGVMRVEIFAQLQTGYLCERVALVRDLQRGSEQIFLLYRLRAFARVNAAAAEKAELPDIIAECRHYRVELYHCIYVEKLVERLSVGLDAAYLCGCHKYIVGLVFGEPLVHCRLVCEVELGVGRSYDVVKALRAELTHYCGAYQTASACYEYLVVFIHNVFCLQNYHLKKYHYILLLYHKSYHFASGFLYIFCKKRACPVSMTGQARGKIDHIVCLRFFLRQMIAVTMNSTMETPESIRPSGSR